MLRLSSYYLLCMFEDVYIGKYEEERKVVQESGVILLNYTEHV